LADESFKILPKAAAYAGRGLAWKFHGLNCISGIDVEYDWLKDWLLIPTP